MYDVDELQSGGFIDPDGKFYSVPEAEHCIFAHEILLKHKWVSKNALTEFEDNERLIAKGWLLMENRGEKSYQPVYCEEEEKITPSQWDTLKSLDAIVKQAIRDGVKVLHKSYWLHE